jgi:PBP1b-binding outer membrane lipoprotein LpoB
MLMRKLVLVLGIVFALGCSSNNATEESVENTDTTERVQEQAPMTGREKNEGRASNELIRRLEKRVSFSEEQKVKILSIASEYDFNSLPKEQRKEAAQKIIAKIRQDVLTPEQIEIMKQTTEIGDDDGE